jgi:rubrerythrin
MAIRAEKDAVIFYEALKDFVPAKAGKEKVENILKEEQGHIVLLSVKRAGLG